MKVYAFLYNPMTEESGYMTMSLHATPEGAEKAMEAHKSEKREEHEFEVEYRKSINEDYLSEFGRWQNWLVQEMEVLNP